MSKTAALGIIIVSLVVFVIAVHLIDPPIILIIPVGFILGLFFSSIWDEAER